MTVNRTQIKVLHVIGKLIPGGVELRTLDLIRGSDQKIFKHYVLVTSGEKGSLDFSYSDAGAQIKYLSIKSLSFPFKLYNFLRKELIDVIHSNIMYTSGYILTIARLSNTKRRIAHFQSDGKPLNELQELAKFKQLIMRKLLDSSATSIVGLTPTNLELAWDVRWEEDPRCAVVSNGVQAQNYREATSPDILQQFKGRYLILHVGRGDLPTKNREKAISVFAALIEKYKVDAQLVFVGRDGLTPKAMVENRQRWQKLADQYGVQERVTFAGERSDVPDFMARSDIFLFTSTLEGLPGVVLEARASGLPIVSSDLPGVKFITGYFTDLILLSPREPDETWADKLVEALEWGKTGREVRQEEFRGSRFDYSIALKEYEALWAGKEPFYKD